MNEPLNVIIAGGGTGGHLFPGIALADAFMAADARSRVLFVSTGNAFEQKALAKAGYPLERIPAEGLKGRGMGYQALSLLKIPGGLWASARIIRNFRPDLVVGVGGYSSGPLVMAAWLMGIRTAFHEQNILPGITNRILARFVDRIYISFRETAKRFSPEKVRWTGNPVRKAVFGRRSEPAEKGTEPVRPFTVLIFGGSQGAHGVNMGIIGALAHLRNTDRFFFIHQTGEQDYAAVEAAYGRHQVAGDVRPFFDDMGAQYRRADLIICRAGATTVAEITLVGKGAIFIPFPFAADNHQVLNARTLADAGAAEMILEKDLSGPMLARRIMRFASDPVALEKMALCSAALGKPAAAEDMVEDCYRLVGRG